MVDTERRHKYHYNRVLIEAERVLNPQFYDAVVFLSGAQIELLRNVSQYLNRLTTYVAEYKPGYYLTPTDEDFDSILEIVADMEETLMGNPNTIWGYKDVWAELAPVESTGEVSTYVSTIPVPEGYVHVLENWNMYHWGGQACGMRVGLGDVGYEPLMYEAPAVPDDEYVYAQAHMTLAEGDKVTLCVINLPDTMLARLRVRGYTMKVPV